MSSACRLYSKLVTYLTTTSAMVVEHSLQNKFSFTFDEKEVIILLLSLVLGSQGFTPKWSMETVSNERVEIQRRKKKQIIRVKNIQEALLQRIAQLNDCRWFLTVPIISFACVIVCISTVSPTGVSPSL